MALCLLSICAAVPGLLGIVALRYVFHCIRTGQHRERSRYDPAEEWVSASEEPIRFRVYMSICIALAVGLLGLSLWLLRVLLLRRVRRRVLIRPHGLAAQIATLVHNLGARPWRTSPLRTTTTAAAVVVAC